MSKLLVAICAFVVLGGFSVSITYAQASRGTSGDLWADTVIGKRDFNEISPRKVVDYKLSAPGGVVVDRSGTGDKLYVWDSGNSRILGLDLAKCYGQASPCKADIVIGQPSAIDYGACNRDSSFSTYPTRISSGRDTLCGMPESAHTTLEDKSFVNMYVDSAGSLYVPDSRNNRVLKYLNPFTTDTLADEVWGQTDFSGNGCNKTGGIGGGFNNVPAPDASSLCFHAIEGTGAGVTFDSSGNMWVVDGGNNRVLRFPKNTDGTIAKTANLVLGQANFTSGGDYSWGTSMNRMRNPSALVFDTTGKLYVADTGNNRILVFQQPFTNGMTANGTFGGPYTGLGSIELDPQGRGMWITDTIGWNARLRLWNLNGSLVQDLPQLPNRTGGGIGVDKNGNVMITTYVYGQNVHVFAPQADGSFKLTKELFSPPGGYNLTSADRLEHSAWVGVTIAAEQLIVSDGRLLFWNNKSSLTNGKAADGYVGGNSFTHIPDPLYGQVKTDASNRVWVTKRTKAEIYQAPLTTGAVPINVISSPLLTVDNQQLSFNDIQGIVPTPDGKYVWISEPLKNRVFRVRDPLTNPRVDVVLGQTSLAGNLCNRGEVPRASERGNLPDPTRNMLCIPGALSIDKKGNLYVSDHFIEADGNWRLLMFTPDVFPTNSTTVLYAPAASKEFPKSNSLNPQSHATFEPAFDSTNRMLVGYNPYLGPRFPEYYNDPTQINSSNPSDPNYAKPDGSFKDLYGWPVAITFDANDNLYLYDANRGQVRIYKNPFGTVAIKLGDANADGIVDGKDYVTWLNNYNQNTTGGPSKGDFNSDGIVDGRDYVTWLNNYGK